MEKQDLDTDTDTDMDTDTDTDMDWTHPKFRKMPFSVEDRS